MTVAAATAARPLRTVFQPVIDADSGAALAFQARVCDPDCADPFERERLRYDAAIRAAVAAGLEDSDALLALPLRPCGDPQRQIAALFRAALTHRFPTDRLLLEVRVDASNDPGEAAELIEACMLRGLEVALDGFAASPASLRLLARFAPRWVKLDGALTRNLHQSMPRQMIAEGIARLARSKGFTMIAQDVASADELAVLYTLGVRHLQSHWIAPAIGETQLRPRLGARPAPRREPRVVHVTHRRLAAHDRAAPSAPAARAESRAAVAAL